MISLNMIISKGGANMITARLQIIGIIISWLFEEFLTFYYEASEEEKASTPLPPSTIHCKENPPPRQGIHRFPDCYIGTDRERQSRSF